MKWIEFDVDNLPVGNVLAVNFDKSTHQYKEKMYGEVSKHRGGGVICDMEGEFLMDCTHYIDIDKYDIKEVNNDK